MRHIKLIGLLALAIFSFSACDGSGDFDTTPQDEGESSGQIDQNSDNTQIDPAADGSASESAPNNPVAEEVSGTTPSSPDESGGESETITTEESPFSTVADVPVLIQLANHLHNVQNTDGSYGWMYDVSTVLDTSQTGYQNVTGITALGLFKIYNDLSSVSWRSTLDNTKDYLNDRLSLFLADPYVISKNLSCPNWTFFTSYLEMQSDDVLQANVIDAFDDLLNARDDTFGNDDLIRVDGVMNRIIQGRASLPGIIPWDLALCTEAIVSMAQVDASFTQDAADAMDFLASYTDQTFLPAYDADPSDEYAGASLALPIFVLAHYSDAGSYATLIDELTTRLDELVGEDGSVSIESGGDNPYQTSAYALLAYKEIESPHAQPLQTYLESLVNGDGAVVDPLNNMETFEVDGEILRALSYNADLVCTENSNTCHEENFLNWLSVYSMDDSRSIMESDFQDSGKKKHFDSQMNVAGTFLTYFQNTESPAIQLIDVLPSDSGWTYSALTQTDANTLEEFITENTGKSVDVQLTSVFVNYETEFAGYMTASGSNVFLICTYYTYDGVDPAIPVIYTFGVKYNAAGKRVIASCSGGMPDQYARVGSTSRPINDGNSYLYTHELFHSMGILHHFESDLSLSTLNKNLGSLFLYGTDCIMSYGYVTAGIQYSSSISDRDSYSRYRMKNRICPICRYLLNPHGADTPDYAESYEAEANWMDRFDESTGTVRPMMTIDEIADQTIIAGETLALNVSVTNGGGQEYYRLYDSDNASGLSLDSSTGELSWSTTEGDAGTYEITIIVYDGTLSASQTFIITVGSL